MLSKSAIAKDQSAFLHSLIPLPVLDSTVVSLSYTVLYGPGAVWAIATFAALPRNAPLIKRMFIFFLPRDGCFVILSHTACFRTYSSGVPFMIA